MENSQQRADKGVSRGKYRSTLHPKFKSFLLRCNRYEDECPYTEEEYLQMIQNPCYYCGSSNKIDISRIDKHDDFNPDNIRASCHRCRLLMFNFNEREFIAHILSIAKYQSNK